MRTRRSFEPGRGSVPSASYAFSIKAWQHPSAGPMGCCYHGDRFAAGDSQQTTTKELLPNRYSQNYRSPFLTQKKEIMVWSIRIMTYYYGIKIMTFFIIMTFNAIFLFSIMSFYAITMTFYLVILTCHNSNFFIFFVTVMTFNSELTFHAIISTFYLIIMTILITYYFIIPTFLSQFQQLLLSIS